MRAFGRTKVGSAWCDGLSKLGEAMPDEFIMYALSWVEISSNEFSRGSMIGDFVVNHVKRGRDLGRLAWQCSLPSRR